MSIEKNIIKSGFVTPKKYFEEFGGKFFDGTNSIELPIIKKPFSTPEDYFENFEHNFFNSLKINSLPEKKNTFKTPELFFEQNQEEIFKKLNLDKTKVISLRPNKIWISSIAASLVIMIGTLFFFTANKTETTETALSYISYNEDEFSDVELGLLLEEQQVTELENELIYNELLN